MTEELVLYTNPMSRGRIARWMLEETGLPYRTGILSFDGMKKPDYLALNPLGKVPTLVHGKAVVTETAAICAYLAETFPQTGLGPKTAAERAPYFRWLFFAAGPLESALTSRSFGWKVPDGKAVAAGFGSYEGTIDALEKAVSASPYVAGDRFTAADVYVGSHIGFGMRFGTMEKRPAFETYHARLSLREAYRRQEALDAEDARKLQGASS